MEPAGVTAVQQDHAHVRYSPFVDRGQGHRLVVSRFALRCQGQPIFHQLEWVLERKAPIEPLELHRFCKRRRRDLIHVKDGQAVSYLYFRTEQRS